MTRTVVGSTLVLSVLLAPALSQEREPTDEALRAAWKRVAKEERGELAEWFASEARSLDALQSRLVRELFAALDRDPYDWPAAPDRPPLFDPTVHCPGDPIPRRWTSESSKKDWLRRVFRLEPKRELAAAWRYDYGRGEVVRTADARDPERVFENALAGFPPDLDLAEALVERALDDGSLRAAHAAFGHAYADREGNAYPSVTLYDAWASGLEIEMPDVECLGIYHALAGDWKTYVAPIPGDRHDELYARIEELFVPVKAQRSLVQCLARAYLAAEPELPVLFVPHADRLHALWARFGTPAALAADLPDDAAGLDGWLERRGAEVDSDARAWSAGQERKQELAEGARAVRATLVRVMREAGALGGQ